MFFYVRSDTLAENTDKENLPLGIAGVADDTESHQSSHRTRMPVKPRQHSDGGALL